MCLRVLLSPLPRRPLSVPARRPLSEPASSALSPVATPSFCACEFCSLPRRDALFLCLRVLLSLLLRRPLSVPASSALSPPPPPQRPLFVPASVITVAATHGVTAAAMTNKGTTALRQFTLFKGKSGGRNSQGRITAFHRGGGAKRLLRKIDLKRSNPGVGIVERIEYDPNRSSKIALVRWVEGAIPPRRHKEECDAAVDEELASPRNKMMGSATVSKDGGRRFSSSFLSGKVNRTRTQDIFSSALLSSSKITAQGMVISSLPFGLGLSRIALAGAEPTFFAPRVRHEPTGGSYSLGEIREWRPDRDIWAHRMKRKAAVSWQSLRQHSTLGMVVAACHDKVKWKVDQATVIDPADMDSPEKALDQKNVSLFFTETPTNPLFRCVDVGLVSKLCHNKGALVCIDGTVASPINQKALTLGADIVLHSATKFIAGHNDVLAGCRSGSEKLISKIVLYHHVIGGVLNANAAYMILRGMKTLHLRVQQQNKTALRMAQFLEEHPKVWRSSDSELGGG